MAGLEDEVVLDISSALDAIGQLESALTSAVETFGSALEEAISTATAQPLELTTDGGQITSDIDTAITDANAPVSTSVDQDPITSEIDNAISSADTPLEVNVDGSAITSEIEDAINAADTSITPDITTSSGASGKTSEANNLSTALQGLQSAGGLAKGEMTGLEGAVGTFGETAAAAVPVAGEIAAGIGVITAVSADLATKSLSLNEAEFRFNRIIGDQADIVNKVDIGGLNTSLKDLTIQVGGSLPKMLDANASIFQIGRASGVAAPQVALTTKEIDALAARAVALNPNLGDVGDVAASMAVKLGRGGKAVTAFGLSLTPAQINLEALSETGKTSAKDLTVFEKTMAAATLASQQLGPSLGQDVAAGASTATVQLKSFKAQLHDALDEIGKPLIPIFIESFKALGPIVIDVAKIFVNLGKIVLPAVGAALKSLKTPFDVMVKVTDFWVTQLKFLERALNTIKDIVVEVGKRIGDLGKPISDLAHRGLDDLSTGLDKVGGFFKHLGGTVADVTGLSDAYRKTMGTLGVTLGESAASADNADHSMTVLATSTGNVIVPTQNVTVAVKDWSKSLQNAKTDSDSFRTSVGNNFDAMGIAVANFAKNGKESLQEFLDDQTKQVTAMLHFQDNIKYLQEHGANELAKTFADIGISAAGFAEQARNENQKTLTKQNQQEQDALQKQKDIEANKEQLITNYGLALNNIPKSVTTDINVNDNATSPLDAIKLKVVDLDNSKVTIHVGVAQDTPNVNVGKLDTSNIHVSVGKSGASGGIVPGALGEPTPILAHGQELILNKSQQAQYGIGQGVTIAPGAYQVNFTGPITQDVMPKVQALIEAERTAFFRQLQSNRS